MNIFKLRKGITVVLLVILGILSVSSANNVTVYYPEEKFTIKIETLPDTDTATFSGWNTSPDGTGTFIQDGDEIDSGVELYAIWNKKGHSYQYEQIDEEDHRVYCNDEGCSFDRITSHYRPSSEPEYPCNSWICSCGYVVYQGTGHDLEGTGTCSDKRICRNGCGYFIGPYDNHTMPAEEKIRTKATCTTDGVKYLHYSSCCGAIEKEETIEALGHNWDARTGKCSNCGEECSHPGNGINKYAYYDNSTHQVWKVCGTCDYVKSSDPVFNPHYELEISINGVKEKICSKIENELEIGCGYNMSTNRYPTLCFISHVDICSNCTYDKQTHKFAISQSCSSSDEYQTGKLYYNSEKIHQYISRSSSTLCKECRVCNLGDDTTHNYGEWIYIQSTTHPNRHVKYHICKECEYTKVDDSSTIACVYDAGGTCIKGADGGPGCGYNKNTGEGACAHKFSRISLESTCRECVLCGMLFTTHNFVKKGTDVCQQCTACYYRDTSHSFMLMEQSSLCRMCITCGLNDTVHVWGPSVMSSINGVTHDVLSVCLECGYDGPATENCTPRTTYSPYSVTYHQEYDTCTKCNYSLFNKYGNHNYVTLNKSGQCRWCPTCGYYDTKHNLKKDTSYCIECTDCTYKTSTHSLITKLTTNNDGTHIQYQGCTNCDYVCNQETVNCSLTVVKEETVCKRCNCGYSIMHEEWDDIGTESVCRKCKACKYEDKKHDIANGITNGCKACLDCEYVQKKHTFKDTPKGSSICKICDCGVYKEHNIEVTNTRKFRGVCQKCKNCTNYKLGHIGVVFPTTQKWMCGVAGCDFGVLLSSFDKNTQLRMITARPLEVIPDE